MRFYETLYIVHPALQAGRLKDIILDICKLIEDSGGKTLSNDIWGKKKLSYAIDKQKYGTYVLYQYNSNAEQVSSFNTKLDQNSNILGYLTSRIVESAIKYAISVMDLCKQIGIQGVAIAEELIK